MNEEVDNSFLFCLLFLLVVLHLLFINSTAQVRYCMRIQWMDGDIYKTYNTGKYYLQFSAIE